MVDLVNQYDPNAEASTFDALPNGTYEAEIVDSNREPISKDKPFGDCLSLCWKVVRGEFEGRLFWQRKKTPADAGVTIQGGGGPGEEGKP